VSLSAANDFGQVLYSQCRVNGTYDDGNWQHTFQDVPLEEGGTGDVDRIALSDLDALVKLGGVYKGTPDDEASYRNRPESACFSVCREQLKDECTMFTYDGLTEDRHCSPLLPLASFLLRSHPSVSFS
jgi:hypothetical protein